jgi:hypothetical protein
MILALALPELRTLVSVLGVALGLLGIAICLRLLTVRRTDLTTNRIVRLGVVALPAVAFYKLLALAGFLVVPPAAVGVASYHLFEDVKQTSSCMKCHVMHPMGNDMIDAHSQTLAARHFRNKWIPDKQCYACHTDYGLAGTLKAKLEGFRHLARYTTRTYREPIQFKGTFNNANCLHCHEGTPKFDAVKSHATVADELDDSAMSCLNCHGAAHPSREQRTPGHADYDRLMEKRRWD